MPEYPNAAKADELPDRLMRQAEVLQIFGGGPTLLDEAIRTGRFPKPVRIVEGGRAKAWLASEVMAWIESRKADRIEPYSDTRPHIIAKRKHHHQPAPSSRRAAERRRAGA